MAYKSLTAGTKYYQLAKGKHHREPQTTHIFNSTSVTNEVTLGLDIYTEQNELIRSALLVNIDGREMITNFDIIERGETSIDTALLLLENAVVHLKSLKESIESYDNNIHPK